MNSKGQNSSPFLRKRLGNFTLLETIGEDSAGTIHRARAADSDDLVILRVLNPALSNDPSFRDQFYALTKIVTQLRHPNLATVLHGGETEENFFIASENHEGESLADWIAREGKLPEKTSVGTALCIASALAHVWKTAQLFHGNLAPNRIFVDDDGDVKLFDLALPENSDPDSCYVAPEILNADPDADCRADIFSLGLILYNTVTAQTPFDTMALKTRAAILDSEQLPDPRQFAPEISDAFCRVLQKMLARSPADRFADWQQTEAALSDLIADITPSVAPLATDKSVLRLKEKNKFGDSHAPVVHLSLAAIPAAPGTKLPSKPAIPIVPSSQIETPDAPQKKSTLLPTVSILAAAVVIILAAVWLINTYAFHQVTQAQLSVPPPPAPQAEKPVEPPLNPDANPQPPPLVRPEPPPQDNHERRENRRGRGGFQDNERNPNPRPPQQGQAGNAPVNPLLPLLGGLVDQIQKRNEAIDQALNPTPKPNPAAPKPPPEDPKQAEEARLAAERIAQQQQERARLAAAFNKFAATYLESLSRRDYNAARALATAALSTNPELEPKRAQVEQCVEAAQRLDEFFKSLSDRLTRTKGRSVTWDKTTGVVTDVNASEVVIELSGVAVAIPIRDGTTDEILALTAPLPTSTTSDAWLNVAWFSFAEGKVALARSHLAAAQKNGVSTDGVALTMAMLSTEFAEIEAEQILAQLRETVRAAKLAVSRVALDKLKESFAHTRTFRAALESLRSVEAMISFHETFAASPANNVFLTLQNPDTITALTFSADGRHFIAASDNTLRIWELAAGQIVRELASPEIKIQNISAVALSPNNRFAFAKYHGNALALWDVSTSKPVGSFPGQTPAAAFTPDGKYLAYYTTNAPTEIRLLSLAGQDKERVIKSEAPARPIQHLAVSPDSKFVAVWGNDRSLQIFDIATGKSHRNHAIPAGFNVTSIALTANAKTIVFSGHDTSLRVFDGETGKEIRSFKARTTAALRTAYSPDGRFALGIHENHKMTLMDSVSGNEWRAVDPHKVAIKAVALSPDRLLAVTASDKTIQVWKLWDTETAPTADSKEAAAPK